MILSINIPDEAAPRVLEALAGMNGWTPTVDGEPNPVTQAQAAKRRVIDGIRNDVRAYETARATDNLTLT